MIVSIYLYDEVLYRLNEKCNSEETFLDFIRDSEKTFGLYSQQFYKFTLEQLNSYMDYLSNLWLDKSLYALKISGK
jgi:hypothetical protein